MLSQTKGILLHNTKYGENSIIATIYTEKFGRQAYIVNSAKGLKTRNKASMLQPLYLLDMVVYQKQSREIQRLKEFKTYETFHSIPFDIKKSTQALFIAEILYKLLREEEGNPELFHFFENAIKFLDLSNEGINNFHLFFLSRLTGFLGIHPNIKIQKNGTYLDLRKGISSMIEPPHPLYMNKYETQLFQQLVNIKIENLPVFQINREDRMSLLIKIIEYYHQHFDSMGEIKSLYVLKEVFK